MRYVIAVLALAGAVVSGLALQVHYTVGTTPCSINEKWDCGVVNHSSYAEVAGVPVAIIGIVGYLALLWLGLVRQRAVLTLAAVAASLSLFTWPTSSAISSVSGASIASSPWPILR